MRRLFAVMCAVLMLAIGASAQFLGYVSTQSVAVNVFSSQAANGASATLQNLGQSAHFLSYCNTGFAGQIALEASQDGTFGSPITLAQASYGQQTTTDSACHVLQAGGYYPAVRARVLNYAGGSVTAFYTALGAPISYAPPALTSTGPTSPIVCDRSFSITVGPSATSSLIGNQSGMNFAICAATFSFNGATTAGSLQLSEFATSAAPGNTCTTSLSPAATWTAFVTANTPQLFSIGSAVGPLIKTLLPNHVICLTTGAVTANTQITYSYAQY
jgi:hypothetical protein